MFRSFLRKLVPMLAVVLALGMLAGTADARVGGGFSMGSRGARTFTPPPATRTAPNVSPLNRSLTQPVQPGFSPASPGRAACSAADCLAGSRRAFSPPGCLGYCSATGSSADWAALPPSSA